MTPKRSSGRQRKRKKRQRKGYNKNLLRNGGSLGPSRQLRTAEKVGLSLDFKNGTMVCMLGFAEWAMKNQASHLIKSFCPIGLPNGVQCENTDQLPLLVDPDPEDLPPPLVDEDPDDQTELEPPKEDPELEKKTIAPMRTCHILLELSNSISSSNEKWKVHALASLHVVACVKEHYPGLFPANLNENRPREWEPRPDSLL